MMTIVKENYRKSVCVCVCVRKGNNIFYILRAVRKYECKYN